ncbi:MAG: hypothetical protein H0W20_03940 [Chthoniobacterales bacterium]|nr:hypothetical protein [Chthoniobacterales bacterium]
MHAPSLPHHPSPEPIISTRVRADTGDNVLIRGIIITGNEPKKAIVRAIGSSLPFEGRLENPTLQLINSKQEVIAENDNWQDAPNRQEIIDSTVAPSDDRESAILTTLTPDSYTAVMRGVGETVGIGLVEAYDLNRAANSKLANISTRGLVQTDPNAMIGGFIVLGSASQKVLIRGLGPSLPFAGKLENPTLQLVDRDGNQIVANDNWKSDQEVEIRATTIPPSDDLESAIVVTLQPAAYTAILRGAGETTGAGLVEIYALQQ